MIQNFVERYRKIAAEFRQIAIDGSAWNNLHPEHEPMDVGNDLVRAAAADRIADAIAAGGEGSEADKITLMGPAYRGGE